MFETKKEEHRNQLARSQFLMRGAGAELRTISQISSKSREQIVDSFSKPFNFTWM